MNALLKTNPNVPIIVVVPLSLLEVWKQNLDLYLVCDYMVYSMSSRSGLSDENLGS